MLASLNLSKLNYFELLLLLPHTTIRLDILNWQRHKENWKSSFKTLNLKPLGVFFSIELLSDLTRSHVFLRNTSITQMLSRQTIWIAYKSVEGGKRISSLACTKAEPAIYTRTAEEKRTNLLNPALCLWRGSYIEQPARSALQIVSPCWIKNKTQKNKEKMYQLWLFKWFCTPYLCRCAASTPTHTLTGRGNTTGRCMGFIFVAAPLASGGRTVYQYCLPP